MLTTVQVSSVSLTGLPSPNWTHPWRELLPSPWWRGVDLAGLLEMTTMPSLTEPTVELESWSVELPCGGREWTGRLQVADLLSSWAPRTTDCRILGTSHWRPARWLPSSAWHRRLAEDPDGCSWSGNWCFDGWAEVVAGMQCPPRPRRCWLPGSCPADSASAGQSLPGKPPPGTRQRCLVVVDEEALPGFLRTSRCRTLPAPAQGRLLRHSPLSRGGRGPQAVKDWRSRSHLLGWRHFRAGLGLLMLLGLPDGTYTVLKDVSLEF